MRNEVHRLVVFPPLCERSVSRQNTLNVCRTVARGAALLDGSHQQQVAQDAAEVVGAEKAGLTAALLHLLQRDPGHPRQIAVDIVDDAAPHVPVKGAIVMTKDGRIRHHELTLRVETAFRQSTVHIREGRVIRRWKYPFLEGLQQLCVPVGSVLDGCVVRYVTEVSHHATLDQIAGGVVGRVRRLAVVLLQLVLLTVVVPSPPLATAGTPSCALTSALRLDRVWSPPYRWHVKGSQLFPREKGVNLYLWFLRNRGGERVDRGGSGGRLLTRLTLDVFLHQGGEDVALLWRNGHVGIHGGELNGEVDDIVQQTSVRGGEWCIEGQTERWQESRIQPVERKLREPIPRAAEGGAAGEGRERI
ncbi:hypothetical protein AGDE_14181 [Angomonas deanei]|nr:hypothetical protein AGDE_14181 [Angomonas deanei]|eukprot:EPY21266.1 hypothetical protein AGDE_14181 [Angomonas deanei]